METLYKQTQNYNVLEWLWTQKWITQMTFLILKMKKLRPSKVKKTTEAQGQTG